MSRSSPEDTQRVSGYARCGLLIVHGIGNQRGGELRDALAVRIADADVPSSSARRPDLQTAATSEIQEIRVEDTSVLVYEANWADISHPDNPPKVRDSSDVVTEFYRTVRAAWHSASQIIPGNRKAVGADPRPMVVWLVIAAILNALVIVWWRLGWSTEALESALNESERIQLSIGLGFAALCAYSVVHAIRKWNFRKREAQPRYQVWILLQLPAVILWGFCRAIFLLLGAEMLFFLSIAVFTAYPVNLFGWVLAHPFRGAGYVLGRLRLPSVARWVHRLGSVMVVLPIHSYLQAVKATGNLFSILFAGKGAVVRVSAFLWFFWVFLLFSVLLVLCELLLIPPLLIFLPDAEGGRGWFHVSIQDIVLYFIVLLPLYLLLLKILLPGIDLVMDVANYHLASRAEREEYFARLDRGMSALAQRGCEKIHLLAHSLGSVIAYDWLHARKSDSYPVVTLHTIGSPLDKFWYVDHGQPGRDSNSESLKGGIVGTWINYWAFSDPVSGKLNRYDAPTLRVCNNRLRWLGFYLWSHGSYWTNETVIVSLRTALSGRKRTPNRQGEKEET